MAQMCGGMGAAKDANDKVHHMIAELRDKIEAKVGKNFSEFTTLKYTSQLVAGTNYFIKIKIGPKECIHVRLYEPLPHTGQPVSLAAVEEGKTIEDPIEYIH